MMYKGELIGTVVRVVDSCNKTLIGTRGKVVDETRNMIVLNNGKMVEKKQIAITIGRENKSVTIDGKLLVGRPEDRLKKVASKND